MFLPLKTLIDTKYKCQKKYVFTPETLIDTKYKCQKKGKVELGNSM